MICWRYPKVVCPPGFEREWGLLAGELLQGDKSGSAESVARPFAWRETRASHKQRGMAMGGGTMAGYGSDSCQITGRTNGRPATFGDYEASFEACERPRKFTGQEVGFIMPGHKTQYVCGGCQHWFTNLPDQMQIRRRFVCEIMRLPGEQDVPASGTCRFWNVDGESFPLLRVL